MSTPNNINPQAALAAAQQAQQQQQKQQINTMLKSATDLACEKCESTAFSQVWFVKRVSPLASPSGDEVTIPIQSFQCAGCGNINKDFTADNVIERQ